MKGRERLRSFLSPLRWGLRLSCWSKLAREPLLPLGLFRSPVFSVANVGGLIAGFALLGTVFFVSQYFQTVQGYTALESGLRTLPTTIGIFLVAPFAGLLAARMTPRLPIVLGALLSGCALFLLTRLEPASSYATIWWNLGMFGKCGKLARNSLALHPHPQETSASRLRFFVQSSYLSPVPTPQKAQQPHRGYAHTGTRASRHTSSLPCRVRCSPSSSAGEQPSFAHGRIGRGEERIVVPRQ